jgi:hypothetical protein
MQMIEPITGANTSAMGDGELTMLLGFYSKRMVGESFPDAEREVAFKIHTALQEERDWREKVKDIGCSWLTLAGTCRHGKVVERFGEDYRCPRLSNSGCTMKRMEFAAKFSKLKSS